MSNAESRPEHLPDFSNPPLNEVVLGVQFNPPKAYQQIYAGEVWGLFRSAYPRVEEHSPIAPAFETFGLPTKSMQFGVITGASHDRFWFLRPDGDELIQFQHDRLLHNWRKIANQTNEYPRFESMITKFRGELGQLQEYFNKLSPQQLSINQCEISYINHIQFEADKSTRASDWLRFVEFGNAEPEDFTVAFREVITDDAGKPQGRLMCESQIGIKPDGQRIIVMTLTARGAPKSPAIESALEFLAKGREIIVTRFAEHTTEEAHKRWGRNK